MTTSMPRRRSAAIAAAESSLTVSATASTPAGSPSTATRTGVLPWADSSAAIGSRAPVLMPASASSRALPTRTACPSTVACTPLPVIESNPVAAGMARPRSRAPATIAAASGCSLSASAAATSASSSSSVQSPGGPDVGERGLAGGDGAGLVQHDRVQLVRGLQRLGGADQDPAWAPLPVPTMMDSGVARPSAHGQAMISTETADDQRQRERRWRARR